MSIISFSLYILSHLTSNREDDFEASQSDLRYLRIHLQAIEVQTAQCMPRNQDPVLSESIMNWKVDWAEIDRRSKERKRRSQLSLSRMNSDVSTAIGNP